MLIASYISKVIATDMPGTGSINLQQNLNFIKPIYHNESIKISIEVNELKAKKK
jgi:3-hydroxybutyryl-CoA dehydratase